MTEARLERLAAAGINLVPADIETHYILERDGFVALVERVPDGFGAVGAAGLLTERGLAPLVWRGAQACFVARGIEVPADSAQIQAIRAFQTDLEDALR